MKRRFLIVPILFLLAGPVLWTAEFTDGRVKLVLHEATGRFSLYYFSEGVNARFEPFFVDQDPRTSSLSVMVDGKVYRMGESSAFKIRAGKDSPSLIFESAFLRVTEDFSFIKTAGSSQTNGVVLSIRAENKNSRQSDVGVRLLIDTMLGEAGGDTHFLTDQRSLSSETIIESTEKDRFWISRNDGLSLMGSLYGTGSDPSLVHFANWKRFNDVPWKLEYMAGRNYTYLPYSIKDSAVSYYFDPRSLGSGETLTLAVSLAAEDPQGFARPSPAKNLARFLQGIVNMPAPGEISSSSLQADMKLIQDLIGEMEKNEEQASSLSSEEFAAIELIINRLKARYGL
ncbi:MAG: hypothetical protein LBQ55_07300 [Treponema sp.]|jgi:hypothetical protein|nr:hypothetical protein [Treponema sp.]